MDLKDLHVTIDQRNFMQTKDFIESINRSNIYRYNSVIYIKSYYDTPAYSHQTQMNTITTCYTMGPQKLYMLGKTNC